MKAIVQRILLPLAVGVCCGLASALFLFLLEQVTNLRLQQPWLVTLLPIGGGLVGLLYRLYGRSVERGNNLLIDEFHSPRATIPFRMTPLVLAGTLLTHLFGGSAGREGTAVQMGGSIADQFARLFPLDGTERRTLLMCGMAGGFGSVFGVPFAGMIFGIEVLAIGQVQARALGECAIAAFVAHFVTLACGIQHTPYPHPAIPIPTVALVGASLLSGVAFGTAARLFALFVEWIKEASQRLVTYGPLRMAVAGAILSALYLGAPSSLRFAGLGVPVILHSFQEPLPPFDWLGKLFFTALTLGTGFKGGEVTPLLFVGSTLGNSLSQFLPIPFPLLAAMGFVAVFAGAANTPIACTIMAMELFGPGIGIFATLACFTSYAVSGHRGIYHAQRVHVAKHEWAPRARRLLARLIAPKKN